MKLIHKIFVAAAALGVFTGCENLEQEPYNGLPLEKSLKNMNAAETWHNGFYSSCRTIFTLKEIYSDIQSDLVNACIGWGNRGGTFHNWTVQSGDSDTATIWFNRYDNIANLNYFIEHASSVLTETDAERTKLSQYIGEAYILRAYYYLQLVQRYCPEYSDSNKNTPELGLPLVVKYDIKALPSRATLEETYQLILSDIAQAKTRLASVAGQVGANYLTIDAVKAIEARALLAKKEYAQAYTVAAALVDAGHYPLATSLQELKNMWHKDATNESIFQLFSSIEETTRRKFGEEGGYLNYNRQYNIYTPDYIPSQWVVNLYDDADLRKDVYFLRFNRVYLNKRLNNIYIVNKYPIGLYSQNSYVHAPKVLRIAEQYLIAAEAAYKKGDETNAKNYLNKLRAKRGIADVSTTGSALFTEIKNERLREFAFEGFRLDDLKRWGDELKRRDPQGLNYINTSPPENFYTLQRAANHYGFVWPIPEYDRQINKNLKQNPGY